MRFIVALFMVLFSHITFAEPTLHPFTGKPIPLSALKGKWVFINYWASWCEPCLREVVELNRFYKERQTHPIALFAVNYDMVSVRQQRLLMKQYHLHYPGLQADPAQALKLDDVAGVPVTFVLNPKGELIHTLFGSQTADTLLALAK